MKGSWRNSKNDMGMRNTTENSRIIRATPEKIYQAFADAQALETWLAPGDMTGKVHALDFRPGGGYEMSLFYADAARRGKTAANEDRFTARFLELVPNQKIVEAVRFNSSDPSFSDEMIMEVHLEPVAGGTKITFLFRNIPSSVRPEDNEKGTEQTLDKLARYVE